MKLKIGIDAIGVTEMRLHNLSEAMEIGGAVTCGLGLAAVAGGIWLRWHSMEVFNCTPANATLLAGGIFKTLDKFYTTGALDETIMCKAIEDAKKLMN